MSTAIYIYICLRFIYGSRNPKTIIRTITVKTVVLNVVQANKVEAQLQLSTYILSILVKFHESTFSMTLEILKNALINPRRSIVHSKPIGTSAVEATPSPTYVGMSWKSIWIVKVIMWKCVMRDNLFTAIKRME